MGFGRKKINKSDRRKANKGITERKEKVRFFSRLHSAIELEVLGYSECLSDSELLAKQKILNLTDIQKQKLAKLPQNKNFRLSAAQKKTLTKLNEQKVLRLSDSQRRELAKIIGVRQQNVIGYVFVKRDQQDRLSGFAVKLIEKAGTKFFGFIVDRQSPEFDFLVRALVEDTKHKLKLKRQRLQSQS